MQTVAQQAHATLEHDIDPDFLASVGRVLAWEYSDLYERLEGDWKLPSEVRPEMYAKRRAECAVKAIVDACRKHGVPHDFRRLQCNGQQKLFAKVGRVVLIQEPMLETREQPRASEYKRQLIAATGLVQQYELDLGDIRRQITDWSGSVVAVLLHAPAGPRFNSHDRSLGALMLGVPNESYTSWLMRLDLHRIAMFGFDAVADGVELPWKPAEPFVQKDNVTATLRRRGGKSAGVA